MKSRSIDYISASKRFRSRKSQAAMEFLMTYGWAILATMIAIGALVYFGITSPQKSLPDKCIFSNNFYCVDKQITAIKTIKVIVMNGMGQTVYNPVVLATEDVPGSCSYTSQPITEWAPDDNINITCISSKTFSKGDKFKYKITINYQRTPTGFTNSAQGEVYATAQ